jgi:LuxR family maltose regulon positive regulatory protein
VTNSFGLYSFIFYPELARVRLLVEQNKKREAASLLAPAVQRAEQPGWDYPRLQVRLMQALCEDDREKSHQYLREALRLAESQGVLRCFLDNGGLMLALLQELRPRLKPAQSAYADQVLAAFGKQTQKPAQPGENSLFSANLVEPLSDRELEVLRLLADGLTNAEIAKRLYLSPNTLKAHTQNIYSKLDVHSRVQVVNKARDLGLLPRD